MYGQTYISIAPQPSRSSSRPRKRSDPSHFCARCSFRCGFASVGTCDVPQGVIPYSISLFFSKLVNYTFLYWLPFYISKTRLHHTLNHMPRDAPQ